MGTSATSKSAGDDSKVNAAVIGVGVGLAAGFTAPLLAGVALSAAGFTSTGIAAGSLAASWGESGGSFFRVLQSAAERGLSGAVAAGLGAALGTAAAVVTLFIKRMTPQSSAPKSEHTGEKPDVKSERVNKIKEEVVETITAKKAVPADVEASHRELRDVKDPEQKPDELIAAAVEEQILQATFVPNHASQSKKPVEQTAEYDVRPAGVQDTATKAVQEVVTEAVIKLASSFQSEKAEIDEAKTEKSEITHPDVCEPAIPAATSVDEEKAPAIERPSDDDVVHHASKPDEEVEMLKEAVKQLVETEVVSEELLGIEECLDRDDSRLVSEEIEILSTSVISSPVMNNSELTEDDIQAAQEPVTVTIRDVLEKIEQQEEPAREPESEVSQEILSIQAEGVVPAGLAEETISAFHHVADQIINEIESVLSVDVSIIQDAEVKVNEEPEPEVIKNVETVKSEEKTLIDEKPESNETQEKVKVASKVTVREEDEESEEPDEAYEEVESVESDDEESEDKDAISEKDQSRSIPVTSLNKQLPVSAVQQQDQFKTKEMPNDQAATTGTDDAEEELGKFSWDTNDD